LSHESLPVLYYPNEELTGRRKPQAVGSRVK